MLDLIIDRIAGHTVNGDVGEIKGKRILVAMWSYANADSLDALEILQFLAGLVAKSGISVIGIHIAEYDFQKSSANLLKEIERQKLGFPVFQDTGDELWGLLNATSLPTYYLFDPSGMMVMEINSNEELQEFALTIADNLGVPFHTKMLNAGKVDQIYLGSLRGRNLHDLQKPADNKISENTGTISGITLRGEWIQNPESIESAGKGGEITFKFGGYELIAVVSSIDADSATFEVENIAVQPRNLSSNLVQILKLKDKTSVSVKIKANKNIEMYSLIGR